MKSKKMLAQIAAFSLVFGMTGVVSSWANNTADEVVVKGTTVEQYDPLTCKMVQNTLVDTAADGSLSITGKDVRGIQLTDGAKLTANNVNFNDKGTANEVCAEKGSTLIVNGGSIAAPMGYFSADSGSTISTDNTTITTGAWANNAAITLKNSTTSGNWLYAGNAFPEDENDKGNVAEGLPVGSITIDGGTASVKNVLVQNKGQFNVTNGAVLDVTKDTSATDTEWSQPATGITKGGEIVVRAWGPNTAQAEKGNSENDPVNKLDQVSTLAVNGATVKAATLTVEGKEAKELNYSESAAFAAKNSTIELGSATLNSAKFSAESSQISIGDLHAENSQMSVKGDLNVSGRMEFYGGTFSADALQLKADKPAFQLIRFCDGAKAEVKKFSSDGVSVILDINTSDDDISKGQGADVTIQQIALSNESEIQLEKGSLHSDTVKLDKKAQLFANNGTKAEIQKMTMDNGSRLDVGSYDEDDMVVKEAADVTVNQLNMKNKSTVTIENGQLNSDQITMDNSTIDLAGDQQKVNVTTDKLLGKGTIATNSLNNKLTAKDATDANITIKGSRDIADQIARDSTGKVAQQLADVAVKEDGKSIAKSLKTDAGVIAGEYSAQVDANGKVVNEVRSQNQTNLSISKLGALSLMTWRQENNDMNKRLGEIRDSQGEQGIWARMSRGEAKYGAQGVKNQYNYYQLGYDHKIADDWILGGAFTYTDGENNLVGGSGTNKNTGFAVYGSNLRDDGSFIDLIAKYAHMKNDFNTIGGVGIGEYSTNGYALSAEYGKRFQQDGFWIEPQAELTYGKVSSADFTTSEGAKVHQDSLDSLVGRLGFSLGKDVKAGNVYVRASYLYDFKGDVAMRMSNGVASDTYDQDLGGSWWEFGVGTNLNFGKDMHFYFDVERTEGGKVDTPWQWNAGVRLSF